MAEATIRSGAPEWRAGWDLRLHAKVESSVGRFACGLFMTRPVGPVVNPQRCVDCLECVGIEISIDLGADRAISEEARVFSDSSERVAAAVAVVDGVIEDLRAKFHGPGVDPVDAELCEVRSSLHGLAGRLRTAALRWDQL